MCTVFFSTPAGAYCSPLDHINPDSKFPGLIWESLLLWICGYMFLFGEENDDCFSTEL